MNLTRGQWEVLKYWIEFRREHRAPDGWTRSPSLSEAEAGLRVRRSQLHARVLALESRGLMRCGHPATPFNWEPTPVGEAHYAEVTSHAREGAEPSS